MNFTPIIAVGLLSAMIYKSRWVSYTVIVLATFISDMALGFYSWPVLATVYLSLALPSLLGKYIQPKNMGVASLSALASSTFFFITTNFMCWGVENMYPHTVTGLTENYISALPFFFNSVLGDQLWTFLLIGAYSYAPKWLRQTHLNWGDSQLQSA